MKVLITGATGYVGGHVAARLVAAGHDVTALVRHGGRGAPPGCRPAVGDLRDEASLRRAVAGRDAVVHLAALVRMWVPNRHEFEQINVEGLASVLKVAAEAGVARVLYTSTIVALGPTGDAVRDETWERREFRFCTDYERTKWIALRLASERAAEGVPLVIVHPGIIYGPGAETEGNLLEGTLRAYLGRRLGATLGRRDLPICYAYIGDVAEGHVQALANGAAGRSYVLGGENATQEQLFGTLHELTGIAPPRRRVPYAAAEAAGTVLRWGARLTGRAPAFTDGVVRTFRHAWAYSSRRAETEIGYRPRSLREGLRLTIEAYRPVGGTERPSIEAGT